MAALRTALLGVYLLRAPLSPVGHSRLNHSVVMPSCRDNAAPPAGSRTSAGRLRGARETNKRVARDAPSVSWWMARRLSASSGAFRCPRGRRRWPARGAVTDSGPSHKQFIVADTFALRAVHDGFIGCISEGAEPGLPKKIHFTIIDVRPEGRIGKNEINRVVRQKT